MRKGHGEPRRLAFAIEAEGGDAGAAPFTRARSTPGRGNAPPFAGAGLLSEPTELQRKARAKVRFFALVQVADSPDKAHTRRVTPSEDLHCELPRLRHGKKPAELRSFQRAGNSRRRSDAAGSLSAAIQRGNLRSGGIAVSGPVGVLLGLKDDPLV